MNSGARWAGLLSLFDMVTRLMSRAAWLGPLLARLTVGIVFAYSGWAKLQSLPKVVAYFESLQIPAAHIQAPFVAVVELVGGVLLIAGFCTRFAAVPLVATMVVAILTAKREDVTDLMSLLGMSEFLYAVLLAWLAVSGPGSMSADARLRKLCG